jgi:SAM-dependent methyltransferase
MSAFEIDWSRLYAARNSVTRRFPSVWRIPVVKKELSRLGQYVRQGTRVLEVGAGDRRFERKLREACGGFSYRSFDIDRSTQQDFYSLEEIEGEYDLIYAFEVIEHMSPAEGLRLVSRLRQHLAPGGTLVLGTPNLYHPHRYWGDLTHVTPYKYEELGALLVLGGYEIRGFYRLYNAPALQRAFRLTVGALVHRWLGIDFATTMLVEATPAPARAEPA